MRRNLLLAAVLVVSQAGAHAAGAAVMMSPQERQEVLAYQLTLPKANQLIAALQAMSKYSKSLPDFYDRMFKSLRTGPTERRAELERDPKAMAILKQNGLTAQEYVVGVPALRMALLTAQGAATPDLVASPANVAFATTHLAELKAKMDAADGIVRPK